MNIRRTLPQRRNARKHLVRISRAQNRNPNRPLLVTFAWRRIQATQIIHEYVQRRAFFPEQCGRFGRAIAER